MREKEIITMPRNRENDDFDDDDIDDDLLDQDDDDDDDLDDDDRDDDDEGGDDDDDDDDDDDGQTVFDAAYVKKLRRENARNRVNANKRLSEAVAKAREEAQNEFATDIASAFGFTDDDDTDPEALLATLSEERAQFAAEARALKVERAVERAARTHKGDAELLLPWLEGKRALDDLDPDDDDFRDQVSEVVESAIERNPKFKVTAAKPKTGRSGGDLSGGNGRPPKGKGPETIDEIRKARTERRGAKLS